MHSLIVEGVERYAAYEEQMRRLMEAIASDAQIQRLGEVYRADDVHAWMQRLAQGESAARPKSWQR